MTRINLPKSNQISGWAWLGYGVAAWVVSLAVTLMGGYLLQTPLGSGLFATANRLFQLDSTRTAWYVTRAAGIVSYLLVWLSTVLGLGVGSKVFNRVLGGGLTFDLHEFTSLLALGFVGLHVIVLLGEQYLPYTLAQILLPFLSPYRPLWVGIGVLALYLMLLVTATFYLRSRIGMRTFRLIHLASFASYFGATLHGFIAGTDSTLPVMQGLYAGTLLVVVALTGYWLIGMRRKKAGQDVASRPAVASAVSPRTVRQRSSV
jgi:predicted ferric reductase